MCDRTFLVDKGADEYVDRIPYWRVRARTVYLLILTTLIYGLHIRLPPYQPKSKKCNSFDYTLNGQRCLLLTFESCLLNT